MTLAVKKKKSGLGINLFGLIFLAVGLGTLLLGPGATLYEHYSSSGWQRVPATLESVSLRSHSGSDSTTYSVDASYRYQFNGQIFSADRVGYDRGSDNLGDYHRDLVRRLERARSQGAVMVWVNPGNPSESYLVRELRWEKFLFMGAFGIVFGGVGLFIMLMTKTRSARVTGDAGPIHSREKHSHWVFAFMALMFLGVSLPPVLAIPEELADNNWPILMVLLFPVAGTWLAYMAWKSRRNWRYYGPTPLSLDPSPGQIGGDIAGRITLNRQLSGQDWSATLQCLKVRIKSGKNSSRSESVLWQADQVPEVKNEGPDSVISFRFHAPEDLPETDNTGQQQVTWRLLLTGPKQPVPLERTYELPVIRGTRTSSIRLSPAHVEQAEQQARVESLSSAAQQIDVEMLSSGLLLRSRAGRNLAMKAMFLMFGLIFGGVAILLGYLAATEGFMLYVMAFMFGLFGFPMLFAGLFMAGRRLEARVAGNQVETIRYWCGLALWKRSGYLLRADQLVLKNVGSMTSGNRTTEYFSLSFQDAGGTKVIRLAEGIAGREVAEALLDNLIRLLQLPGNPVSKSFADTTRIKP